MPFMCPFQVLCTFHATPLAIMGQSYPVSSPDDFVTALHRHCAKAFPLQHGRASLQQIYS